ncbi:glutamine synthetase family protein [Kineococcus rhizosphaerae]|uniref:Glutamine synthetase n=1 Tax=Kineococcus rhizosphaerae TaxID=559628 RepID=A0A2T0QUQ9_9ACTN|nr:glutamine synthetase family protein [Kineococcus rhizosphaerae]PRY08825.1 glutamine synthetase [Kineococcus rhizosphaerae]
MSEYEEVKDWLSERGVRTVRLDTISLDGVVSGKYVSVAKFLSGLKTGWSFCDVAFGVDLANVPQLGFDYGSWRGEMADVTLRGDSSTLALDPHLVGLATVLCDLVDRDGAPLPVCSRSVLRRQVQHLTNLGYSAKAAIEIEATVFEESIDEARRLGFQGLHPLGGSAGALYVIARPVAFTRYLDAVTERLDEMGIAWEGWCDESAAGQVEINLPPTDPMTAVDNYNRVKLVMRQVAFERGHSVTFMARWSPEQFGQGAHINLSLYQDGENVFHDVQNSRSPSALMREFMGGVLETMPAATSFSFPTINSYRRIEELNGPPTTVSWGLENKSTAVRAICRDAKQSRIEYRIPSADANLYLAFAALLAGGLLGLQNHSDPGPSLDHMAWALPPGSVDTDTPERLPRSLSAATDALAADTDLTKALGPALVDYWIGTRRWEWFSFHTGGGDPQAGVSQWELTRYFELV